MLGDKLSPVLAADGEMLRKVKQSTVSLVSLVEGWVRAEQIERAFSSEGCGAILIKLDGPESALYDRFYRLQWQLGWAATVHGVRRIEDTGFSRGQAVVHVQVTEADLV